MLNLTTATLVYLACNKTERVFPMKTGPLPTDSLILQTSPANACCAGGRWETLNERLSLDVVLQLDRMSCVSACGEMVSNGSLKQKDLMKVIGYPVATEYLAKALGNNWEGAPVAESALDRLLQKGSWVADVRERMGVRYARLEFAHAVVVDGLDISGNIMIRDPAKGMRYEMTRAEFLATWTGTAVFRK